MYYQQVSDNNWYWLRRDRQWPETAARSSMSPSNLSDNIFWSLYPALKNLHFQSPDLERIHSRSLYFIPLSYITVICQSKINITNHLKCTFIWLQIIIIIYNYANKQNAPLWSSPFCKNSHAAWLFKADRHAGVHSLPVFRRQPLSWNVYKILLEHSFYTTHSIISNYSANVFWNSL